MIPLAWHVSEERVGGMNLLLVAAHDTETNRIYHSKMVRMFDPDAQLWTFRRQVCDVMCLWRRERRKMTQGWIGVDLDGTLAHYDGWNDGHIGEPIAPMVERVKGWLDEGKDVRIMTARVARSSSLERAEQRALIEEWCIKHFGVWLLVTAEKDMHMIELWDDRAITVEFNTGRVRTFS